jgi:GGDEF domain-containing protein
MGALVGNAAVLLTIAEVCGIWLTTYLAYRVNLAISEFENALVHMTIGHGERITEDASLGAGSLYREVRRARNHQRPLSLMALAIEENSLKLDLDRIVQEAQRAMVKQYALSGVSNLLSEKLEDCDLIVKNNEHFLVLLPETKPEDLPGLIDRLRRQVSEKVGVELKIGVASLPHDSYTLEGLIDQATQGMETDLASEFFLESKRMFVNKHVS